MKNLLSAVLLLAGFQTTAQAVPTYEAFMVTPQDVVKQTVVTKASTNHIDALLTPAKSAEFFEFTKRNLGKPVIIQWSTVNKSSNRELIQTECIFIHVPVANGHCQVEVSNPNWISRDSF